MEATGSRTGLGLKVQNILVDKRENPSICDFGISKLMGSRGFTTSSVGTAPYMAPELFFVIDAITHNAVWPTTTKSSDVYSFGLLVLEILTGEPPKRRPSRPIINSKEYSGLCPERSDYPTSSISDRLWVTCLVNCWRFEPEKRPSMKKIIAGNHFSRSSSLVGTDVSQTKRPMRQGFWNRRGDHLTTSEHIVYVPEGRQYPKELEDYPDEEEGYRDESGLFVEWADRPELEDSRTKYGKAPKRPSFDMAQDHNAIIAALIRHLSGVVVPQENSSVIPVEFT
ncbi:kinase-like domain-containing protein [Mycena floridula]|nr:kinase-like domain-containing protein [Mycena floridula]